MVDYAKWRYKNLQGVKQALEGALRETPSDGVLRAELKAVDIEIGLRKFRLIGLWDRREVVEYGRYRTEADAKQAAADMDLPIDGSYELGGKLLKVLVDSAAKIEMSPT